MSNLGYQALGRLRFETYHDKLNHVSVAGTFYNNNGGYYGYMGAIRYLYWTYAGGVLTVNIRNFASDGYGLSPSSGDFTFNYKTIVDVQAIIAADATPDPTRGIIYQVTNSAILLYPYNVVAGVIVPYTLLATDAVNLEVVILRNSLDGEAVL